jgi:predicted Zn-dependent protease
LQAGLASPQSDEARRFLDLVSIADNAAQAVAAKSRVEEILKSDSDYVPALMVVAAINEQNTNLVATEQTYEKVLNHFPDFAPAQKNLAVLYAEDSSNPERAYALAIKARDSFPDDSKLEMALGILVFRQGDYMRAVSLLKGSAVERSTDAELFYYLGSAQYRLKNRAESKASLQRALNANLSGKPAADASQMLAELK